MSDERKVVIERVDDVEERWRFRITYWDGDRMVEQRHARAKDISHFSDFLDENHKWAEGFFSPLPKTKEQ